MRDEPDEPVAVRPGWKRVFYEQVSFDVPAAWAVANFDQTGKPCGPPARTSAGVILYRGPSPGGFSCPASFPAEEPPPVVSVQVLEEPGAFEDDDKHQRVRIGDGEGFLRVDGPGYAQALRPDLEVFLRFSYVDPEVRNEILSTVQMSSE